MKTGIYRAFSSLLIISVLMVFSFPNIAGAERVINIMEGKHAPNFALKDLGGHTVKLSEYRGKTVLLLFMTTWIKGCWEMIPRMKEFYSLYGSKGLIALNIDIMESKKRAERFAIKHGIPYPTLLDEEGEISRMYDVHSVPIMVLIDGEGRIICWGDCPSLDKLLKKQFKLK